MINKILIVDDQTSVLTGLSNALRRYCEYSGEITTVMDGESAIDEVTSCYYDICFLDINLPGISGLEVMEKMQDISPVTRVVIMTASYLDDDTKKKIENDASLFLQKPIELDVINDFVKRESKKNKLRHGTYSDNDSLIEKREVVRKPCQKSVQCFISVFYNWELKSNHEASIIDISSHGAGLKANYAFYPGNVLRFDEMLGNKSGIVKWSMKTGEHHRAGIELVL